MSAHIPEFRRMAAGRTWREEWNPYAGTHYRRPSRWRRLLLDLSLAAAVGAGLAWALGEFAVPEQPIWHEIVPMKDLA